MHELGHEFDFQVLTDRDRHRLTRLVGYRHRSPAWFNPRGGDSPGERFANAYAYCALRIGRPVKRHDVWIYSGIINEYNYDPSQRQYDRVCALIRRAARRTPLADT